MAKRLFIAFDISERARRIAADHIDHLKRETPVKGIGWVRPENLHVTVKFLGETDETRIPQLIDKLKEIIDLSPQFNVHLSGPEILGKRVVSLRIAAENETAYALRDQIEAGLAALGFTPEDRRFHPHLTLGRIRDPRAASGLATQHLQTKIEPVEFGVREIVLYESELKPAGSVYTKVGIFPLVCT